MGDDSVETPIGNTLITGALRRPPSLLPWILFGVTGGVLVALTLVLLHFVFSERERADAQAQANVLETARADKAELALRQAKAKVEPLEEQVKALTAERDELLDKVKLAALNADKPSSDAAVNPAPVPPKPVVKKAAAKKKPVKKKKRR